MTNKLYTLSARLLCFICHGGCCRREKNFKFGTFKDGTQAVIDEHSTTDKPCPSYNPRTGGCINYENRMSICVHWKCRALNILSRLFGEPEWTGRWIHDYHPLDHIS